VPNVDKVYDLCVGTGSDEVFQHLSGRSGRLPDAGRGSLPSGCAVPQQHTCGRRNAVQSRAACDARTRCTYKLHATTSGCGQKYLL